MTDDSSFPRLVSLACHDLRTPLATVYGFARTLARMELAEPADRYVEMIDAAAAQLGDLLDQLGLVARIEAGRYEPPLRELDTGELARDAAAALGEDRVSVSGAGGQARADPDAAPRAVAALVRAALRHGGLDRVEVAADGPELRVSPVRGPAGAVLLGEALRDLGAAAAVRFVEAIGGSVALEGETLRIRLPGPEPAT